MTDQTSTGQMRAGQNRIARRTALGLAAATPAAIALASPASAAASSGPSPVRRLRATSEIGRIRLSWEHDPYRPFVDHYAVYGARTPDFEIGPDTLVAKTIY